MARYTSRWCVFDLRLVPNCLPSNTRKILIFVWKPPLGTIYILDLEEE